MLRDTPLIAGETYHIFNRGAHKQRIFTKPQDYRRFQLGLHLANHSRPVLVRDVLEAEKYREPFSGFFADKSLVEVLAYSLMPNHFHLVLRQKVEEGITRFMRKVSVGYSMYFNIKYEHSGTLFQGRFKSSHIDSDPYFKWIFSYVHLNPVSTTEPDWKEKGVKNHGRVAEFLREYPYSSYYDYYVRERPERTILAHEEAKDYIDTNEDLIGLISKLKKESLYETFESVEKKSGQ